MMNALQSGEYSSFLATPENEPILPRMNVQTALLVPVEKTNIMAIEDSEKE